MKKAFVYGLLAALTITGCQAEQVITQEPSKVFTAIVDEDFNSETKTSLDGEGNVLWKKGDQVSIFEGSALNEQYQVTDASDGKTAATLNKIPAGGFVAGTEIDNNVAFYPYASTAEIAKSGSNYIISEIELPATQNYAAGSFGNGAFPMATVTSSTEDKNLKFKNVLGGLKLQLKGTSTITSITVTGNNNEILYGDAEVTMAYGGVPSITLTHASAKTVTLNCGAGVTLDSETVTPFIIALPPMTMTGGFTVVVTDTEGKQMQIKTTKPQTIIRSNLLKMPAVNYVGVDYSSEPFTITSTGSTSVSIRTTGSPDNITLEYRKGTDSWTAYTIETEVDLLNGECIQFRAGEGGNESFSTSEFAYYNINVSGEGTVNLSGNIMSLLDRSLLKDSVPSYAFCRFCNSEKIVDASNLKLPATALANNCYCSMFSQCTSLTTAPELPATKLAEYCYYNMFEKCTSLTTAPNLPATTLADYCYSGMFRRCTSLTTAPKLPAPKLAEYCYQGMFQYCTNLTTAPELSATTLAKYCYSYMFRDCTNLNYIKMLATDISASSCLSNWVYGVSATGTFVKSSSATWDVTGVNGVPSGWTIETPMASPLKFTSTGSTSISLTKSGTPDAITLEYKLDSGEWTSYTVGNAIDLTDGQEVSFRAGASGNSSFSQSYSNYYQFVFSGSGTVAASGNIMSLLNREGGLTIPTSYCFANLFEGCTSLTTAPKLPATTLADGCYSCMFFDCTKLTTAPDLPATTLAPYCCLRMFSMCTSLTTAPDLPATTLDESCYDSMFYGCTSLTTAPELPATTLSGNCYAQMFQNCGNLNYITMLATDVSAYRCLYNWVDGVSATGTFVKSSSATWDVTGVNGVPDGWTVITE